jgi:hypothetical protein
MIPESRHPSAAPTAKEPQAAPYPLIILKSYADVKEKTILAGESFAAEHELDEDPFASMTISDQGLFDDVLIKVDGTDEELQSTTSAWINKITQGVGMPTDAREIPDDVDCLVTHASSGEAMYEQFWMEVARLVARGNQIRGSSVIVSPRFAPLSARKFELFEDILTSTLADLRVGSDVQLVFFHPEITIPNNAAVLDVAFARRSPYPMVSFLPTQMVEEHKSGEPVGSLRTRALIEIHERLLWAN